MTTLLALGCGARSGLWTDDQRIASSTGGASSQAGGQTGGFATGGSAMVATGGSATAGSAAGGSAAAGSPPVAVSVGAAFGCALGKNGALKCWGLNVYGELGLGDDRNRGDAPNQMGKHLPSIKLGARRRATAVATGYGRACALLDDATLKCWGDNNGGLLGLGDQLPRGDKPNEMGDALPAVDLGAGRRVQAVAVGDDSTCALLVGGAVKCWGLNGSGELGLGDTAPRGALPQQMGDALPAVDLGKGRGAIAIATGDVTNCALLDDGSVKCWGDNHVGQLGLGDTNARGDQPGEMGDQLPAVALGTGRTAKAVAVGYESTCALLDNGSVKCWGYNGNGELGLGDTTTRGDQPGEMGDQLPAVNLGTGRSARAIAKGSIETCALLDDATVKCWGDNQQGALGQGDTAPRGALPTDMGDSLPPVSLGAGLRVVAIAARTPSCALLDDETVKCWGDNQYGGLGLGDTNSRGSSPGQMGDNLPALDLAF